MDIETDKLDEQAISRMREMKLTDGFLSVY
jgi:hypothetical protein